LLSDTNPTFIGSVYEFPYLLIYLHYRSIKWKKFMKGCKRHVISVAGVYVEKWQNTT